MARSWPDLAVVKADSNVIAFPRNNQLQDEPPTGPEAV